MKKYLNIKEVSQILNMKEHVIRYWDSIDPKTNKVRIEGISTKSNGGTRYFNKDNISKLEQVKDLLYDNGNNNYPLNLANKFLTSRKTLEKRTNIEDNHNLNSNTKNYKKISQILKKMRFLLK